MNRTYQKVNLGFAKEDPHAMQFYIVKNVIEKYEGLLVSVFIDLTTVYDHIPRDFLFRVLSFRTGSNFIISLLKQIYEHTTAYISGTKVKFDILIGCREGGLECPILFNYYFDFVLKICAFEIDQLIPDGWGVPFNFIVPNECTNRQQRADGKIHGRETYEINSVCRRPSIILYLI